MDRKYAGLALAAAFWAAQALAQARVEAVQYPAWLERGGQAVPLMPGTALQPKDGIRTGGNARVRLVLGEGSAVKLGENARFEIEQAGERGGVFQSALSVIAGAFRFTTLQARKRDVAIKVKNVTVGIRGTDLWGKSTDERNFVVLIEGNITMSSPGHPPVTLDKPLDVYQRVREAPPEVVRIDPKQLEEYAKETEIPQDGATANASGQWRVVAAVFPERDKALDMARTLRSSGYPIEVVPKDRQFAVQVPGLASEADARSLMGNLRAVPGVTLPHVKQGK